MIPTNPTTFAYSFPTARGSRGVIARIVRRERAEVAESWRARRLAWREVSAAWPATPIRPDYMLGGQVVRRVA